MWILLRSAKIDNVAFKLFYRCTVLILVVFSFVITCKLVFGDSFWCTNNAGYDPKFPNVNCYARTPFTVSSLSKHAGNEVPYPGVSQPKERQDKLLDMSYYPWVNIFFLVLAVLFYLPHLLWRVCEGGLVGKLVSKVNDSSVSESERKAAVFEIAKHFLTTRGGHLLYAGAYVLAEAMNWLLCVLLTIWLVDFFKVEMYYTSGELKIESWNDFFDLNFPMVAQCRFNRTGASGTVQMHSSTCLLPLNKLYGYMYLFLFAWFIMLCVVSGLVVPYRICGLVVPPIRQLLFRLRSGVSDLVLLDFANEQLSLGDWFLLTRLEKNMLPHDLSRLLMHFRQNINKDPFELEMDDIGKMN